MAQLQVTVIEGRKFKKMDLFSANDAFVKVYLDVTKPKQKTKVKHNEKNPHWNQTLFLNHLRGQDILYVDVYDKDTIKNDIIGSLQIDLHDLYDKKHIDDWYNLPCTSRRRLLRSSNGQIHLILDYQPLEF